MVSLGVRVKTASFAEKFQQRFYSTPKRPDFNSRDDLTSEFVAGVESALGEKLSAVE